MLCVVDQQQHVTKSHYRAGIVHTRTIPKNITASRHQWQAIDPQLQMHAGDPDALSSMALHYPTKRTPTCRQATGSALVAAWSGIPQHHNEAGQSWVVKKTVIRLKHNSKSSSRQGNAQSARQPCPSTPMSTSNTYTSSVTHNYNLLLIVVQAYRPKRRVRGVKYTCCKVTVERATSAVVVPVLLLLLLLLLSGVACWPQTAGATATATASTSKPQLGKLHERSAAKHSPPSSAAGTLQLQGLQGTTAHPCNVCAVCITAAPFPVQ